METQTLKNRIQGSQLKEEYLEAFLLQGVYIEGIIKQLAGLLAFIHLNKNLDADPNYVKFKNAITGRIEKYGLYDLIDFLHDSGHIDDEQRKNLHSYRLKRNNIIHSLLTKMKDENLERELEKSCKEGDVIVNSKYFKEIESAIITYEATNVVPKDEGSTVDKN